MRRKVTHFLKQNWQSISIFFIFAISTAFLLNQVIPSAKPILYIGKLKTNNIINKNLHIVAIGDSLTEGIGDSTNSGGYVPMLEIGLNQSNLFVNAKINNYGKSGNDTTQLKNRIVESKEIQGKITTAKIVLITVGANDLMKVIKTNMFNKLTLKSFEKPKEKYKTNLTIMYQTIRKYNANCSIYHMGIYNPFYLNFNKVVEMQEIVNTWNDTTKKFIESQEKSFYIPINDQIYQGNGVATDSKTQNNLLSEEDSFHPNNTGYQIIANSFRDKIVKTKDTWLK